MAPIKPITKAMQMHQLHKMHLQCSSARHLLPACHTLCLTHLVGHLREVGQDLRQAAQHDAPQACEVLPSHDQGLAQALRLDVVDVGAGSQRHADAALAI